MPVLFILLVVVPVIELMLLLKVGAAIGALNTIALVFLTAFLGAALLRREGLATLTRVNQKMNRGELPANEIVSGFALAAGGALLLTPGFMTDAVGFALVLPGSRAIIGRWLLLKLVAKGQFTVVAGKSYCQGQPDAQAPRQNTTESADVIEGEYRRENE